MPRQTMALVLGTLDLLVLRSLAGGAMHGYGIATQVNQQTAGELAIEDAALYQALHRLDRQGLVDPEWHYVLFRWLAYGEPQPPAGA